MTAQIITDSIRQRTVADSLAAGKQQLLKFGASECVRQISATSSPCLRASVVQLFFLCIFVAIGSSFAEKATPVSGDKELMRVVSPVLLCPEPGSKLNTDVLETRNILDGFHKDGYEHAVWYIEHLPEDDSDIGPWVAKCLEAFPAPPILALDSGMKVGFRSGRLKLLLSKALPKVHSVIVNFPGVNSRETAETATMSLKIARRNAELVRKIDPEKFIWLLLLDDAHWSKGADPKKAAKEFGELADGYWMYRYRWICWNAEKSKHSGMRPIPFKTSKPVIRAPFQYSATRARPALVKDMTDNYKQRMKMFEEWTKECGYSGYAREIGESIPNKVSVNQSFHVALPEEKTDMAALETGNWKLETGN